MDLVSIFTVILLIFASVLCIALVIYLNRITKAISNIEDNAKQVTREIQPLVASVTEISKKINSITEDAKEQVSMSKETITKVKNRIDEILDLEEKIRQGFEGSALDLIQNLSAVANGVSAFWNAYRKK